MFRINLTDFEFILAQTSDLISLKERLGETNPIRIRLEICIDYTLSGDR